MIMSNKKSRFHSGHTVGYCYCRPGIQLGWGTQNTLESNHLQDRDRDDEITLRWILGGDVVMKRDGWNWFKIVLPVLNRLVPLPEKKSAVSHCHLLAAAVSQNLLQTIYFNLTPQSRVLEKQIAAESVNKFPDFYVTERFIAVLTTSRK